LLLALPLDGLDKTNQETFSRELSYVHLKTMRTGAHSTSLVFVAMVAAAIAPAALRAQDVGKIVSQYAKAEGGAGKLSKITTVKFEGTVTGQRPAAHGPDAFVEGATAAPAPQRASAVGGTYTFALKLPNRYYTEMVAGDESWIESFNGKSAWRQSAKGEIGTLVGSEGLQLEAAARYFNSRLLNLKKNRLLVTFVRVTQRRGKDVAEVEVTAPSGAKRQIFFDTQTHLIEEESALVGGVPQDIYYDEYRGVNGVQMPYKIQLRRGDDIYRIEMSRVEVNEPIGERTFDFPKKAQVVLPDLKTLFAQIDNNQKAIDKIKEDYAGTKVEEETDFEGNGKSKKAEIRESTFFYLDGTEVSTLVKKNGKALSDEEQKKEIERVTKEVERLQKDADKKDKKDEQDKEKGKDSDTDDGEISMETFLRACQFVNPRRERFRGADVLVFDFEPNPEFKAHSLIEKIIQKLGGVIWIDEKALDVARLDAFFVSDVKIAGGLLADVQKGTRIILEQEFVNSEVWLPTYEFIHLDLRLLLVKGFHVDGTTRYSDYKKFNVATIATIGKPKGAETDAPTAPPPSAPARTPTDAPKPQ
jgi:hypothetical protein